MKFPGKIAVVTGASEGIGFAIAKQLAERGCRVALIARQKEKLNTAAAEINAVTKSNTAATAFVCDLQDQVAIQRVFEQIKSRLGCIDMLINNAGTGSFAPLELFSLQELAQPMNLPVVSTLTASRLVIEDMKSSGDGSIVNIITPAAYFPLPYMCHYTASRWALLGLTRALDQELEPHGIHVASVCPGRVNTEYIANNDADFDWWPRIAKIFPVLEADDVATRVIDAIQKRKHEVIFPWLLWFFVKNYQHFPRTVLRLLKALRLFQPPMLRKSTEVVQEIAEEG